ncbi:MAG: hypothetical protein LBR27_05920 [Bifidobacteriaceae bacterium]|nr:hypothetical protein [Bifidobacteriaceae bacterium]
MWRAPIDNERDLASTPLESRWRRLGLDRLTHRLERINLVDGALEVTHRTAPAATDLAFRTVFRWSCSDQAVTLDVFAEPEGTWPVPLPRIGLRLSLPAKLANVAWFGLGPGETYPDSRAAARIGHFESMVAALQTPYVFPQENGHRSDVRWVRFLDKGGHGLEISGRQAFGFTARPWTSETLDKARHASELVASERVWVTLDSAVQGLGSASCGPGPLSQYDLIAGPVRVSYRTHLLG